MTEAWRTPRKLHVIEMAFPAHVLDMMPPYDEIPQEFLQMPGTKWNELFARWFYSGVKILKMHPKPGIEKGDAMAVLRAIMGSFEPSHEHKEAAVAYLMSLWFEDATWE